ncbi:hypothetical protein [Thalassospira marina]|uniref:Uncharacterized protein n=1 Tax=Thalassospira marina TaxID=2048283 RepID=A0ABN5FR00_9PROT|nr:hypothetical protein [Thalassospira marina]AUG55956.1 hypothetical protein CSC3H3_23190 [Thalassospira marina]
MLIDTSQMPVILIRSKEHHDDSFETQFQQVLDRNDPFVLVSDHSPEDHEDETREERKQRTLFMKKVGDQMRKLCRGMIMVTGKDDMPAAIRLVAANAGKAFGFPIMFVKTEAEGIAKGRTLFDNDAGPQTSK